MSFAENNAVLVGATGTANSTPLVTSYVNAKHCGEITLIARLGDMASETIDIALYQASDSGGTGAKSLKAATQLAASAGGNDNSYVVITARADELDVDNGFEHVAGRIVTGGATGGTVHMTVLGSDLRYQPASLVDAAAVLQIVP